MSTQTQSFSLGWLILYAELRTFRKLTECFVHYNLCDHAKQNGTRGKMQREKGGEKKKTSKCRIEEKVTTGVGYRAGMKTAEGKWLSPSRPPSLFLPLSTSLSHLIHYADIHSICFLSEPPACQRSWNAHTSEYKHTATLNVMLVVVP